MVEKEEQLQKQGKLINIDNCFCFVTIKEINLTAFGVASP